MKPSRNLPQLQRAQQLTPRFVVLKKIGEGAFGAVYKLAEAKDPTRLWAVKLESIDAKMQILKLEVFIIERVNDFVRNHNILSHFCKIEAKGRTDQFNYMVMTLVGPSLYQLKKRMPANKFTFSTALRAGLQCLSAIRNLHSVGYLHRDIKPSNFSPGHKYAKEQRIIYLLDFGMCRKYVHKSGKIKTPRASAGFRGTTRYASINCHEGWELARKDDLETWFYQQVELTKPHLPWRSLTDKHEVLIQKERCRRPDGKRELLKGCPAEYGKLFDAIETLKYYDDPDYDALISIITTSMKANGCLMEDRFDWEKHRSELPVEDVTQVRKLSSGSKQKRSDEHRNREHKKRQTTRTKLSQDRTKLSQAKSN